MIIKFHVGRLCALEGHWRTASGGASKTNLQLNGRYRLQRCEHFSIGRLPDDSSHFNDRSIFNGTSRDSSFSVDCCNSSSSCDNSSSTINEIFNEQDTFRSDNVNNDEGTIPRQHTSQSLDLGWRQRELR